MTCDVLASQLGTELTVEALAHLRECEDCLNASAAVDPFLMFRSLRGQQLEPPGGTDAFVAEVMQQVESEERRRKLQPPPRQSSWLRWGAAAAVLTGALTVGITYRPGIDVPVPQPAAPVAVAAAGSLLSRPVVEHYEGANAFIVEVPESSNDIQLVMIFDESLPADL